MLQISRSGLSIRLPILRRGGPTAAVRVPMAQLPPVVGFGLPGAGRPQSHTGQAPRS
jgi:hypothetical protein